MRRHKRCRYCDSLFLPHPAVGSRQKSCSAEKCRTARKAEAQRNWVERNSDYFGGRYETAVKPWLEEHAGYQKLYRRQRRRTSTAVPAREPPAAVGPVESTVATAPLPTLGDIQDELIALSRSVTGILAILGRRDIQDELTLEPGIQSRKEAIQTG